MVGYSDSTKDAGRLAAAWALFRAQEDLAKLFKERDLPVKLVLFHGKGGSVSRGGGTQGKGEGREEEGERGERANNRVYSRCRVL